MLYEHCIPLQSGCDSFYESREDTIAHLALYHKQFELKMDERGKNINVREHSTVQYRVTHQVMGHTLLPCCLHGRPVALFAKESSPIPLSGVL